MHGAFATWWNCFFFISIAPYIQATRFLNTRLGYINNNFQTTRGTANEHQSRKCPVLLVKLGSALLTINPLYYYTWHFESISAQRSLSLADPYRKKKQKQKKKTTIIITQWNLISASSLEEGCLREKYFREGKKVRLYIDARRCVNIGENKAIDLGSLTCKRYSRLITPSLRWRERDWLSLSSVKTYVNMQNSSIVARGRHKSLSLPYGISQKIRFPGLYVYVYSFFFFFSEDRCAKWIWIFNGEMDGDIVGSPLIYCAVH